PPPIPTLFPYTTLFRSNNSTKSMRTDLMFFLQNFSAVGSHCFHRIVESPFHGKINERPVLRRLVLTAHAVTADAQATGSVLLLRSEEHTSELQSLAYLV